MSRKIKQLPNGTILFHYTKNGKVVSDLEIDHWYENLAKILNKAIQLGSTLIIKIGTENMVNATRRLVIEGFIPHQKVRYRYGRRVFRIDLDGRFVGIPGKHYPKDFLNQTEKIQACLPYDGTGELEEALTEIKNPGFSYGDFVTVNSYAGEQTVNLNGKPVAQPINPGSYVFHGELKKQYSPVWEGATKSLKKAKKYKKANKPAPSNYTMDYSKIIGSLDYGYIENKTIKDLSEMGMGEIKSMAAELEEHSIHKKPKMGHPPGWDESKPDAPNKYWDDPESEDSG